MDKVCKVEGNRLELNFLSYLGWTGKDPKEGSTDKNKWVETNIK